ncbi:MAG: alpha/beta hydrolase [Novosphingobium sp.]
MNDSSGTRHLIDPELLPALEMLPAFEFNHETLPAIREGLSGAVIPFDPPIAPVEKVIEGPDGAVSVFWFDPEPSAKDRPALLHIHGGGMVIGSARLMPHGPSTLAASIGLPVASVEYRLAPETPFPGPQEDCYAALAWMARDAAELGIDPSRIGVTGESAGGLLAAAVAQMARDRGGPKLAAQILVYPMLDHRVGGDADPWRNRHTGEFVWTRKSNQFGWESLRGDYLPNDARKGWFSPSLADDVAGLPPTWIGVGNLDLFFDEDLDYARRLVDAGVPVELHAYPGAFHGFDMLGGAGVTKAFARDRRSGTARLLGVKPPSDAE